METLLSSIGLERGDCAKLKNEALQLLLARGVAAEKPSTVGAIRLALFGQYNAGKSTLVNALLGQKRAPTGDSPETKTPQRYETSGFDIIDLPGGDARIAEQSQARAALDGAHAVLYVVSSQTGLDYQTFWSDLRLLQERAVPFLLVINDKQPHESDAEATAFSQRVLQSYRDSAMVQLGTSAPAPYWVCAARAEKGRLQAKEPFVLQSGIIPLETALARFISQNEPFLRSLRDLGSLRSLLRQEQERAARSLASDDEKRVADALQRCDSLRQLLSNLATTMAEERFGPLRDAIAATLGRGVTSAAKATSLSSEVTALCEGVFGGAIDAYEKRALSEFAALQEYFEKALPKTAIAKGGLRTDLGAVPKVETETPDVAAMARRVAAVAAALKSISKSLGEEAAKRGAAAAGQQAAAQIARRGGEEALERGAANLAKGAAGDAGKGLGKAIGPIVVAVVAAWEIWDAFKRAEREQAAIAAALREVEAKATLAAVSVKDEFLARAHKLVSDVVSPVSTELRSGLAKAQSDRRRTEGGVAEIAAMLARLGEVCGQLEARLRV